ncbi:MAG TPA: hypothetical protein VGY58_07825 [Gemmataceae bacterium]|jgi:hypothetical protein|nr:hypothetical protein [Gemmataceae bacterium]
MNRFRFRISTLMALVLMAGTLFSLGRISGDIEAPLIAAGGLLVLGVLGTATLGAIYRRGERRAFWVGFSVFGWPLALVCLLFGAVETEILFFAPMALPFGWIGGAIARWFASNPGGPVKASPAHQSDWASVGSLAEDSALSNSPTSHIAPASRSHWAAESR